MTFAGGPLPKQMSRRAGCGKKATVDRRPWRNLLAAQRVIGTSGRIVRMQDSETGEVLTNGPPACTKT
jgi:hypothetical protein